jgi:hypothetical protein
MLGQLCLFRRWSSAVELCSLIWQHQTFERTCCLDLRVEVSRGEVMVRLHRQGNMNCVHSEPQDRYIRYS